ncbi:histidinol-phosphate aminotransferase, partial [Staphylococcus aureus]|nr:histidinol-phosphate aminotransferase [Staphylococcus aureus]
MVRLPFNVTSLSAVAADAAIKDQAYLKDITTKNRHEIEKFLNAPFKEHIYDSQT